MDHFLKSLDRWKIVEWAILVTAVIVLQYVHGLPKTIALVLTAILLVAIYNWWRRKGVFRNRT
jgi:hypothetical protein